MVLSEELLELLLHITKNAAGAIFRFSDPVSLAVFPPGAGGFWGEDRLGLRFQGFGLGKFRV